MRSSTDRAWILPALLSALLLLSVHREARAGDPGRAGLVIQNESGEVLTRCVEWEGGELSGADVLLLSGLDVVVDTGSSMGVIVCQIEGQGCAFPGEACFCQCTGGAPCIYWNYYSRDPGETDWLYSVFGAAVRRVKPGSVEAWVWGEGKTPPAADLTFERICAPPSPTAEATHADPTRTPLPPPAIAQASATPTAAALSATAISATAGPLRATDPPATTGAPATSGAQPTPPASSTAPAAAPAGSDTTLAGYWPFGVMLLGLAGIGALVWRRRG